MTSFSVGSLVRARGREWVVLPRPPAAAADAGGDDDLVLVRPLGGTDAEVTGILTALEEVLPATFGLPDPSQPGDELSARLLRDALRLGFRSSAGPFRCFGRLAVEPRPYQLVPLLMALKLDPVRLLIADDVGIGKTVEAGLVAAELLEQGDARRLALLCPPHLAEQWQSELATKFHIDAELVLASTAARLERNLGVGRTIFDAHPFVVVSTDFIKSDRRRDDFLRTCPELVIVDEAHTCAYDGAAGGGRARSHHQRHELVAGLAADPERHLILVTATPHSGKEAAFRSLLELVDPSFVTLPDDLSGDRNREHRSRLAAHLVQRRRADIRAYLDAETPFPARLEAEETYRLSPEYRALFDRALAYARETVRDPEGGHHRQRVRWWSALALLRSLASSPAAAAETLRNRASPADTSTAAEADEVGRRTVLDEHDDEAESPDVVPGSDIGPASGSEEKDADAARSRRALRDMAHAAESLKGEGDAKLVHAARLVGKLVADGARPIVFCRFIATADYVAGELRARLPRGVEVAAVTGTLAPSEREARIAELAIHERRVLVATDCLSEGINLQDSFDAVFHYDLPWNPTRLEQREGRVDRFGQRREEVRVVTYYGADNQIDEIVLDVLLRKHRTIRSSLGISVPVPGDAGAVIDAVAENLLIRHDQGGISERLPGMEEFLRPTTEQLLLDWTDAAEQEKRSRTLFAQSSIKVDEVARELAAVQGAIGSGADVASFVPTAVVAHGGTVAPPGDGAVTLDLSEAPLALRDALGVGSVVGAAPRLRARFSLPVAENERYLSRTDPLVAGLASYVLDTALDPLISSAARRCGVIRTDDVTLRTTLLLVRYRFHLVVTRGGDDHPLLAEDCAVLGFTGPPATPNWLAPDAVTPLLEARPSANVDPAQARDFLSEAVQHVAGWRPHLDEDARARAEALYQAHERVRTAARQRGVRHRVEPQLPPDLLGIYVYLPAPRLTAGL